MENLKLMVDSFIFNEFSADMRKLLQKTSKNITEKNRETILDYCLKKAWNDTVSYERYQKKSEVKENSTEIKKILKNEIETNGDIYKDFDFWHEKMCKNEKCGMRCGLWQKFINMTYKYLYCVSAYGYSYGANFEDCHMPLDHYTLNWYHRKTDDNNIVCWNNLTIEDYKRIRDNIKMIVPSEYTPLEYEFYVWPIEKMRESDPFSKSAFVSTFLVYKNLLNF